MKKIKRILPTVCYGVLLIAIALLSFLIVGKNTASSSSYAEGSTNAPVVKETPDEREILVPENEETPSAMVYSDVLPRESSDGKQKIYGEGNVTLTDVVQTAIGNYVFLSSDCKKGDIAADSPCIGVLKTDNENNILAAYTLPDASEPILTQATISGIVLISKDTSETHYFIRIVDYSFGSVTKYKIAAPLSVRVVPTETGFLVFTEYDEECLVYSFPDRKMVFQSVEKASLVELFEYSDHYLAFCNRPSGDFFSVKLDKNSLSPYDKKFYNGNVLVHVTPIFDGKATKYLTVEKGDKVYAKKYAAESTACETEKELGSFEIEDVSSAPDGIVLLCSGNVSGYMKISSELLTYSQYNEKLEPSNILCTLFTEDGYYCLLKDEQDNVGFIDSETFDVAQKARMLVTPQGKILLFLEKKDNYSYVDLYVLEKE